MDKNKLVQYCLSKKGSFEDYPFGFDVLVIKVGSKMFALISERGDKLNISLKCDPFLVDVLRQQYPAVTPGYHLNKRHWNTVEVGDSIPEEKIIWMIDHSYDLVFKSLTKSEKQLITSK
ncbi:MmcQ/YjbR family DNA-binding protein [Desulforamulus aquiferis]|uniref:MmcQ/YjbR family DNA-binding protein n=1 Tax=Desulforamulus aquiferis TaxID=1397668 RepID=A0AAW7Z8X6_9FIRM|nr:MmcQ/YjbR family DNA-binding protein [Desulforamulus aquiferis]MDO7785860.1 MmcQ/YjbR family DNA-binding protein [Desulforamulus aquiferis]RYD04953.1 hypothetical protein N752_11785 [Desulforamulus aquiferis]